MESTFGDRHLDVADFVRRINETVIQMDRKEFRVIGLTHTAERSQLSSLSIEVGSLNVLLARAGLHRAANIKQILAPSRHGSIAVSKKVDRAPCN
jgi:hypothetical protein